MASLRNLVIGILRRHGHRNIAAALRRNARDATPVPPLLSIPRREPDTPYFAETLAATMVGVAIAVSASRTFPGGLTPRLL
jgi:hypothetical protein